VYLEIARVDVGGEDADIALRQTLAMPKISAPDQ
jgi:hypothetical protein